MEEVGITVWSEGSRPSPKQEVPAGPRSSKSEGMPRAWICSALCQEGLPGPGGGMGAGPQGQGWRGNRVGGVEASIQWLKTQVSRERGTVPHGRNFTGAGEPKSTPTHGKSVPHWLTSDLGPPSAGATRGEPQVFLSIHPLPNPLLTGRAPPLGPDVMGNHGGLLG